MDKQLQQWLITSERKYNFFVHRKEVMENSRYRLIYS
jgi:hypothetical protein